MRLRSASGRITSRTSATRASRAVAFELEVHVAGSTFEISRMSPTRRSRCRALEQDVADNLVMGRFERAELAVVQQFGEADNRVQRSAQLVRDAGQKAALGVAWRSGPPPGPARVAGCCCATPRRTAPPCARPPPPALRSVTSSRDRRAPVTSPVSLRTRLSRISTTMREPSGSTAFALERFDFDAAVDVIQRGKAQARHAAREPGNRLSAGAEDAAGVACEQLRNRRG